MLLRRHYKRVNIKQVEPITEPKVKVKLEDLTVIELKELAREKNLENYYKYNKSELIEKLRE